MMTDLRPTSIKQTPEEREAMEFLKEETGEISDAAVRRRAIFEFAKKFGWKPSAKKAKKPQKED